MAVALALLVGACSGSSPKNTKASTTRADLARDSASNWQLDQAEAEAHRSLSFNPKNSDAHWVLGSVDFQRASLAHMQLEVNQCLTGIDAQALMGDKARLLTDADKHFAQAVKLDPRHGEAWAIRGVTATLRGRYDDAIGFLERALDNPARLQQIAVVRANLGWAHFHKGDMLAATRAFLQVLQFKPDMCLATYRLGRVYFARKEWEKALQKFREVTENAQCRLQDPHLYIMKTYQELGAVEKLSGAMEACIEAGSESCVALQCRALASSAAQGGASAP